jgi:hypothetical protein
MSLICMLDSLIEGVRIYLTHGQALSAHARNHPNYSTYIWTGPLLELCKASIVDTLLRAISSGRLYELSGR